MMKKIWGLMIILCFFIVSVASGKEMNFNLDAPDQPTLVQNHVNVRIEKNGIMKFSAGSPQLNGTINMRLVESLTLDSGDYAGWGYAFVEYNIGKLKGTIYFVFNNDEYRGMLSGDILGVAEQTAGLQSDMTWKISSIEGTDVQATVNIAYVSYKAGKTTMHEDVWMPVLPGFTLSANDYSQTTTVLLLPAPDGNPHHVRKFKGIGLEFGTYETGTGKGILWALLDNTEMVDPPFNQRRYGTRDGVLAGTSETIFQQGENGNSIVNLSNLFLE